VAEALRAQPALAERIANVQVMGGAVDAPGNVGPSGSGIANDVAEWNIHVDPAAADVVIRTAPVTLVALDATQSAADGTSVRVAVNANAAAFERAFLETLNRRVK
jgi:inosine-uridine nucleoside N-ribohydrolase